MDARSAEVLRLLDRYLVEIVEAYELCPWARAARDGGELAVEILWGHPALDAWIAAAVAALARPGTRVAMIVAPEFSGDPRELRAVRDRVVAAIAGAGVADFHPDAAPDLATPARLVPHLRRAPDPLLQLVPLALLDSVRGAPPVADLARQAQLLVGGAVPARGDVADRIAETNHARVRAEAGAFAARLAELAADRERSYARVGISACRRRR
ncbi:MAG: hypothetical protein ACM31C_33295 [Acidobacteriota bacterium]